MTFCTNTVVSKQKICESRACRDARGVRTGSDVVLNIDFGFSVNYGHQHYGILSSKPF